MKLSEAKKKYIGKKFRIKHAERGYFKPYVIEGEEGICTAIKAEYFGAPVNLDELRESLPDELIPKPHWFFRWRIDIPGHVKWFTSEEIEPVEG